MLLGVLASWLVPQLRPPLCPFSSRRRHLRRVNKKSVSSGCGFAPSETLVVVIVEFLIVFVFDAATLGVHERQRMQQMVTGSIATVGPEAARTKETDVAEAYTGAQSPVDKLPWGATFGYPPRAPLASLAVSSAMF